MHMNGFAQKLTDLDMLFQLPLSVSDQLFVMNIGSKEIQKKIGVSLAYVSIVKSPILRDNLLTQRRNFLMKKIMITYEYDPTVDPDFAHWAKLVEQPWIIGGGKSFEEAKLRLMEKLRFPNVKVPPDEEVEI